MSNILQFPAIKGRVKKNASLASINRDYKKIDKAVYNYLAALKVLDKFKVSSTQIAQSLDIPQYQVIESMSRLSKQGMKIYQIC